MQPSSSIIISEGNISQAATEQHQSQVEALKGIKLFIIRGIDLQQESKLVEAREQREAERLESQLNKVAVKRQVLPGGGAAGKSGGAGAAKDEKE